MIKMKALKDVPSVIGTIQAGADFWEPNEEQVGVWERTGVAIRYGTPTAETPAIPDRPAWDHRDWDGMSVAIIASGESLTVEQCELVRQWRALGDDRRVMAVNTSYRRAPFADIVYACDRRWWDVHYAEVSRTFRPEQLWTQQEGGAPMVNAIRSIRGAGLSKIRGIVHQGANSGYQAIGLAVMWGAKRIILLGFDCQGTHWHGEHPSPISARMPFDMWLQNFRALAPDLLAAGVGVVNCSPKSAIQVFKKRSLEDALCLPSVPSAPTPTTDAIASSPDSAKPATTLPKRDTLHRRRTF